MPKPSLIPENKGVGTPFLNPTRWLSVSSLTYSLEKENDLMFIRRCWALPAADLGARVSPGFHAACILVLASTYILGGKIHLAGMAPP